MNLTSIHDDLGLIPHLTQWVRIQHCCELWCRSQMQLDPTLLWLWRRLVATAPIRPLAWEPPYATGAALEKDKKAKKKKLCGKKIVRKRASLLYRVFPFAF